MSEMFNRLKARYWAQRSSRLPAGYREVEYLESDREAMLDTGVVFTGDLEIKCRAFFKYMAGSVVRARYNVDGNSYQLLILTGNNREEVQGAYNLTGINNLLVTGIQYNTWFDATLANRSLAVNGVTDSTGSQTIPPNSAHIYVNAVIYADGSVSASQSVFSKIEIKHGTSLVRNLIPCVRVADSKPGMYDLCGSICPLTGTPFYVNAGTGADFLWKEFDGPNTDEVWYWAPEQVTLYSQQNVVSHTFSGGKGVVKFNAPLTALANTFYGTPITAVKMPNGISGLKNQSFMGTSLVNVKIPDSLKTLNGYAFYNCLELESVEFPPGIVEIDQQAFKLCSKLLLSSLPSTVTTFGVSVFESCSSITISELPSGVTVVPNGLFSSCKLESFRFHSGITEIGNYAFYLNRNLSSVTFDGTPTSISSTSFSACPALNDIYVPWSSTDAINADAPWGATNATIHYNHVG